ncbi:MAG: ribose 5-phosphate isomerase A [Planctomycetes bacterium]|nr:ribose 5-phosphate isomerase A [Planctomycetota bacterium]
MDLETLKGKAALEALTRVESGMRLGLGTGSTVAHFLKHLGEALREGRLKDIVGVPTSERTASSCKELGIPTVALEDHPDLDLGVDGADEVDPSLELIKGLGGALLREKMVASSCRRFVVIADETKRVANLFERSPLPVEIVPFAWRAHLPFLRDLGADPTLRTTSDHEPYRTDNGNVVVDCRFTPGARDAREIARALEARPGVVEHGLFLGMANEAILAAGDAIEVIGRER